MNPAASADHDAARSSVVAVGIDVGATKIVAGLVDTDGYVVLREAVRLTSGTSASGLVGPLTDLIARLTGAADGRGVIGVGVGTAGVVGWPEGDVGFAANHGHRGVKLRARLQERSAFPVVVDNDANVAVLSAAAAHPGEALLFLAVGTGLGSGFLVGGEVVRWPSGYEVGHIIVDPDGGTECTCGKRGCLELVASGRALKRWARHAVETAPDGALATYLDRRKAEVSMRSVIDAGLAGIPEVLAEVDAMGVRIGTALARSVMSLTPVERVVVGGGLSVLGRILTRPIHRACRHELGGSRYQHAPTVLPAEHGADAVLIGSGLLAHRQFGSRTDPAVATVVERVPAASAPTGRVPVSAGS